MYYVQWWIAGYMITLVIMLAANWKTIRYNFTMMGLMLLPFFYPLVWINESIALVKRLRGK